MVGSSPAPRGSRDSRQSFQWASPDRDRLDDFLTDARNSELSHKEALAAAQAEHTRIRQKAEHVYDLHLRAEEQRRILEEQQLEQERLRAEEAVRAEAERLRALRAKSIPKPPPEPEPQPEPARESVEEPQAPAAKQQPTTESQAEKSPSARPASVTTPNGAATAQKAPAAPAPPAQATLFGRPSAPPPSLGSFQQASAVQAPIQAAVQPPAGLTATKAPAANPFVTQQPAKSALSGAATPAQPAQPAHPPANAQAVDRYSVIHQNLKQLRASLAQQAAGSKPLKSKMGDMRREIRKSVGQLTSDKGSNKRIMDKMLATLKEGLANGMGSPLVDPGQFVHTPGGPVEGAQHNDQLPSIFIYLLNQFSKAAINQFINECGANPRAADPIGVAAAHIFSDPTFHWRGQSLIDVLIAKYRVACPVLFGLRGSERTEQGRQRLGWRRKGAGWATEQEHMDRMTGLGAGWAAISLRDFQRSKKQNPWPPRRYWEAFAKIVNTPPQDISDTQCNVLKAMIDHYEQRFIGFYGTAGVAALRLALVDFPARAPAKTTPVTALQVHAQLLRKDAGLRL